MTSGDQLLWPLALGIGSLSLIAVGGINALIPALHERTVVETHWLSDANFSEAVALGQAAPGPNMLLVPLIGWQAAGLAGALVAFLAFAVPTSTVAILGSRLLGRYRDSGSVKSFTWALRPVTGGLMIASAIVVLGAAARTFPYPSGSSTGVLIIVASVVCAASLRFRLNPLVWIASAAILGALA